MAGRVTLKFKLRQLFALEEPIIESLADFSQTLTELTDELPGIQPPASVAARQRIDQGHTSYASLAREWHDLQPIARAPASKVYTLIYQLNDAYAQLHLLELRHIHRRNLDIVEQQLATHQKNPLVDEVRASLQHMIDHEQRAIQKLERQRWQSASDQELLATHRRNLQWCQEMLAGARPVVPVKKLHELSAEEKAIREIDQQLALSHSL